MSALMPEKSWCVVQQRRDPKLLPISTTMLVDERRAREILSRLRDQHPGVTYTLARLVPVEEPKIHETMEDFLAHLDRLDAETQRERIATAIGDDEDPGFTGEALDAWNAATARAVNIARNWKEDR